MIRRPHSPQSQTSSIRQWLLTATPLTVACATTLSVVVSLSCDSQKPPLPSSPKHTANTPATLPSVTPITEPAVLQVRVDGITSTTGDLIVYVYDAQEGYLKDNRHIVAEMTLSTFTLNPACRFSLPPGRYAVVAIHDLNKNGDLDTNILGIPTEPWGVSQGARPRFRAPTFEESVVNCPPGTTEVPVSVR